ARADGGEGGPPPARPRGHEPRAASRDLQRDGGAHRAAPRPGRPRPDRVMATLTPEAKSLLSSTIGTLREHLLRDLHEAVDRRYRFSASIEKAGLDEATRTR